MDFLERECERCRGLRRRDDEPECRRCRGLGYEPTMLGTAMLALAQRPLTRPLDRLEAERRQQAQVQHTRERAARERRALHDGPRR